MNQVDAKPYLEYLDKEMTIMGILSVFCVASIVLLVDKIAGATASALASLWARQADTWLFGAVGLFVAALFFYRQRSYLAWYYGQITLAQIAADKEHGSVREWLRDADSWETWLHYRDGFVALSFGFFEFAIAVLQQQRGVMYSRFLTVVVPLVCCVAFSVLQRYVLTKYRFHDEPWAAWRHDRA